LQPQISDGPQKAASKHDLLYGLIRDTTLVMLQQRAPR
jgi:hypothetical protein